MKRILVIDDDSAVLDVLEEILKYDNYHVRALSKTKDIFADIDDCKPDVILLDYLLLGVNGGELCRDIKRNPHTRHIPVIITSAYPRASSFLKEYGYDAFIEKPFDLDSLLATIREHVDTTFSSTSATLVRNDH